MSEEKLHGCFFKQEHGQKRGIRKCRFIKTKMPHKIASFAEMFFRGKKKKKTQGGSNTLNMSGLGTFRANSVSVSS